MMRLIFALALLSAIALTLVAVYRPLLAPAPEAGAPGFDLAELLASEDGGDFARVGHPYRFSFPADHGRHGDHRTETWHLSGVLESADGRRLGLQLALARVALGPAPPTPGAGWSSAEIYAGQFTLSDPGGAGLLSSERLSRGGIGLADWQADPLRLWIEDWSIRQAGSRQRAPDLDLRIAVESGELSLRLRNRHELVSADDLAGAGDGRGPPFVYYVQPRMEASGELRLGERLIEVSGNLSLEHAWGELPLPGGPVVRDRFNLYLDDGRVVLLFRSHRKDASGTPTVFGILTQEDGRLKALGDGDIELEPLAGRTDETGNAQFPLRWKLRLPAEGIDLRLAIDGETGRDSAGTAALSGTLRIESGAAPLAGSGFAQLIGYRE